MKGDWRCLPRWLACGVLVLALVPCARAEERPEPVDSARKALQSRTSFPWYDAEADTLRPITLPWEPPDLELRWLKWPLIITFGLVVGYLVYLIVRGLLDKGEITWPAKTSSEPGLAADQVEALPFMADRSRHDLLGEARRHYELGNFSEAIIYLFSYELVELDKSALIHLGAGKTNRQYLREVSRAAQLRRLVETTMVAFEDVFFGQRPLDRRGFEDCWNRLGEFETLIAQASA